MAGKVLAELNKMPVIGRKTDILKDTNVKLRKIDKIFKMKFCQQNFFFFSQVRFQGHTPIQTVSSERAQGAFKY